LQGKTLKHTTRRLERISSHQAHKTSTLTSSVETKARERTLSSSIGTIELERTRCDRAGREAEKIKNFIFLTTKNYAHA
jgi:hypothetical protein